MGTPTTILLRIALRNHRVGFLILTVLPGLVALSNASAFGVIAGETEQSRLAFAQSMELIGYQLTYLLPVPNQVETIGGYLHWRVIGFITLMFSVWGVMAATGSTRAQEDQGNWEQWISVGASRLRLMVTSIAAFAATSGLSIFIVVTVMWGGAVVAGETLALSNALQEGIAIFVVTLTAFSIGATVAQLTGNGRTALSAGATLIIVLFFLNSLSRSIDVLTHVNRVSPFFWVDRTNAMVPGGSLDGGALTLLLAVTLVLSTTATTIFIRRDLGSAWWARVSTTGTSFTTSRNPLVRIPIVSDLYEQRLALTLWTAVIGTLSAFVGSMAKSGVDFIEDLPRFEGYRSLLGIDNPYEAMLGVSGFSLMQLILAAFAITTVARWASDDTNGRLEMTLSAPVRRWRVVAERALMLTFVSLFFIFVSVAAMVSSITSQGVHVDVGLLAKAACGLLPFSLSFGAIGAAIVTRNPRLAVGVLSVVAITSFFILQIGPWLRWPDWIINLSVFNLYGSPVVDGTYWPGMAALTAITIAGFGIALRNIQVRDIGR
jgi:ABC-2 type transport system permease protein